VLDVSKMEGAEMRLQLVPADIAAWRGERRRAGILVGTRQLVREWPEDPVMAIVIGRGVACPAESAGNALKSRPLPEPSLWS